LLDRNIKPDIKQINAKLSYYNETYSFEKLKKAVCNKEKIWKSELKGLLINVPDFEIV